MKVLLTRAGGPIGITIATKMAAQGMQVTGIDVLGPHPGDPDWIQVADITMPGAWEERLAGVDVVIHQTSTSRETGDVQAKWDINVRGTQRLFRAALTHGVQRAVLISSTNVLGPNVRDEADEDYLGSTGGNIFSEVLLAAEHRALQVASHGLPVTIVRPSDVYGPGVPLWTTRVLNLLQAGRFRLPASGTGQLRPTYLTDVADGVIAAALSPEAAGTILNLVGPQAMSTKAFFAPYAALMGKPLQTYKPLVGRKIATTVGSVHKALGLAGELSGDAMDFLIRPGTPSGQRAKDLLGWEATITPEQGFARIAAWVKAGQPTLTFRQPGWE